MSLPEKEFFVVGIVEGQHRWVMGRCGEASLCVGDEFGSLYEYEPPASLDAYARNASRMNGETQVALRVEAIQAYGRHLDHLGPGMTGTLVLSGTGCEHLKPGSVLGPANAQSPTPSCSIAEVKQA